MDFKLPQVQYTSHHPLQKSVSQGKVWDVPLFLVLSTTWRNAKTSFYNHFTLIKLRDFSRKRFRVRFSLLRQKNFHNYFSKKILTLNPYSLFIHPQLLNQFTDFGRIFQSHLWPQHLSNSPYEDTKIIMSKSHQLTLYSTTCLTLIRAATIKTLPPTT